jgi:hypothetical protein
MTPYVVQLIIKLYKPDLLRYKLTEKVTLSVAVGLLEESFGPGASCLREEYENFESKSRPPASDHSIVAEFSALRAVACFKHSHCGLS